MSDKHHFIRHDVYIFKISDTMKTYLWQDPAFPHFYHNPAVVKPSEEAFCIELAELDRRLVKLGRDGPGFEDVLTEEIVANSVVIDCAQSKNNFPYQQNWIASGSSFGYQV